MVRFLRRECKEYVPTSDINLVVSLMNMFDSLIDELQDDKDSGEKSTKVADDHKQIWTESIFLFSLIWSIGATMNKSGYEKFDKFLRELLSMPEELSVDLGPGVTIKKPDFALSLPFPDSLTIFDYVFDKTKGQWSSWASSMDETPPSVDCAFHEIIVPTVETGRVVVVCYEKSPVNTYRFKKHICVRCHILTDARHDCGFLVFDWGGKKQSDTLTFWRNL